MPSESTIIVESHRSAATLYATGELTTDSVLRAIAQVEQLPEHVRALCVDLRGVPAADPRMLRALEIALRDWRAARCGVSRVKLSDGAGTSPPALRFTHKRWTPPRPVARVSTRFVSRIRDQRRA